MRKEVFTLSFIFCLILIGFVSAEMLISDAGVRYDNSIMDKFNNGSDSVLVWVKVKNNQTQNVFDTLNPEEITLRFSELFDEGFEGNMTNSGFDKLISNPDVQEIYDMTGAYPSGGFEDNTI